MKTAALSILVVGLFALGCGESTDSADRSSERSVERTPIIIDSDANNELDDQHAIAYALLNGDVFDVKGITVNRTSSGGSIEEQAAEARRVVELCGLSSEIPVHEGASATYREIVSNVDRANFDGNEAVDFIIEQAHAVEDQRLVLIPIGKLTNIALALEKDPSIASKIRIVWLGSNFPDPGEYNLENDTSAVNPVIASDAPFEIAVVRYNRSSGTAAVQAFLPEIKDRMPDQGPHVESPVEGRHGGTFTNFGDYSVDLFTHVGQHARALYDVAAVAVVKNPAWAERRNVGPYRLEDGRWIEKDQGNDLVIWELFYTSKIIEDFYRSISAPTPVDAP